VASLPAATATTAVTPAGSDLQRLVVSIDGPAGSGKSTVARGVARRLGLRYLDTGAMYRAVTCLALDERVDLEDGEALAALAERTPLELTTDPERFAVLADGQDVTQRLRTRAVSNAVSAVSAVPGVRAGLVRLQRDIIGTGGIVVEGRDIGTVVAPDAQVKVFLTASSAARAERRFSEIGEPGEDDDYGLRLTQQEIDRRDRLDSSRESDPLQRAEDAVELDSTGLGADEVMDAVLARCPVPSA
jgi:CMP/dCMP kinase